MANIKSAEKRNRQSEKRRQRNSQVKSSIRTAEKKVRKQLETQSKENVPVLFKEFVKKIDTAARKGIVHWKTAARKKSRLAKKVNAAL
ncbi:MAG: 30S ribosomal protein S20 [Spirochaetota bacterium]